MASSSKSTLSSEAKRARLNELGREHFVTDSAKAGLIRDIKRLGIPEAASRSAFERARRKTCSRETPFGALVQSVDLPLQDGGSETIFFQHPLAMLHACCEDHSAYRELIIDVLHRRPSTPEDPWGLMVYNDEVGVSPLSGHDSRETQAVYWTFRELGHEVISRENGWFTMAGLLSDTVSEIEGGMSHVFSILLRFFFDPNHDFRTGIFLPLNGETLVFANLLCFVADEKALKGILHFRGASSWFPCPVCINITSHACPLLVNPWFQSIRCVDRTQWKSQTPAGARDALQRVRDLAASGISANRFEEEQKKTGWSHYRHNIIMDSNYGVEALSYMGDWFHICLVGGMFNLEIVLFMSVLANLPTADIGWHTLQSFLEPYIWPKAAKTPHQAFASPTNDAGVFSGQGSACLSLYPVLRIFILSLMPVLQVFNDQVDSMLALCKILDILVQVNAGTVTPDDLDEVLQDHAIKFARAYASMIHRMLPKHHWARHLPDWWRKFGILVSLFVLERKHKWVKRYVQSRKRLTGFSKGIIEHITLDHLRALASPLLRAGLEDMADATDEIAQRIRVIWPNANVIKCARVAVIACKTFTAGDVVFVSYGGALALAEVWFHIQMDGGPPFSAVSLWVDVPDDNAHARRASPRDNPIFLPSDSLLEPTIYRKLANGDVMALLPPSLLR